MCLCVVAAGSKAAVPTRCISVERCGSADRSCVAAVVAVVDAAVVAAVVVVQGTNESRARADKAKKKQQAVEAVDILADGGNPYQVFRSKDIEQQKERTVRRLGLWSSVRGCHTSGL